MAPSDRSQQPAPAPSHRISVVVPARDCEESIADLVRAILAQASDGCEVEVTVVDNESTDRTAELARSAGARVLNLPLEDGRGNPAAARNLGSTHTDGDLIVFLDSDCMPEDGWLRALVRAHDRGEVAVGGSLDLPPGLGFTERMDYYCGAYHSHSRRPAGYLSNHTPANVSVCRTTFEQTSRFTEEGAAAYSNEERAWQGQLLRAGRRIYFEPKAIALHYNRPGFANILRRQYRWGYNSIETKAVAGAARMAWIYRYPRLLIVTSVPMVFAQTAYVLWCWLRAGLCEPLLMLPGVLASRAAYCSGMVVGTCRWLRRRQSGEPGERPRWE